MLADLCIKYSVKAFMAVSSNLAREPESVVGLTKYVSEAYLRKQAIQNVKMLSLRMPNVLGSPGSVTEFSKKQIISGGPLTVTDARMERRFISRSKASDLLLNSLDHPISGDVLVMVSENTKIVDLAKDMIKQSGQDIGIEYIGAKKGEKLIEQRYEDTEVKRLDKKGLAVLMNDWQQEKINPALKKLKNKSEKEEFKLLMNELRLSLQL